MNATNRQIALIILAVIVTISLPILAAIAVARNQAIEHEESFVKSLALGSLNRTEQAGDQLAAGSRAINALPGKAGCSPEGLALMRQIDLSSTLLQAVGHFNGTTVDCSSFAGPTKFELGPPDFVGVRGTKFWTSLRPFDGKRDYVGVGMGSFLGIVHKDLLLSYVDNVEGLSIATFSWSARKVLIDRGDIGPRWVAMAAAAGERTYSTDSRIVAVVKSKRYDIGAVAMLPLSREATLARQKGMILVPIGLVAALLLSSLLVRVLRSRLSMPMLIRSALRNREFHLVYQPAVDLVTGRTVGAEALIRWRRPGGEMIPPDSFIEAAEQAGVIGLITARVLELLAQDARDVLRVMPDFHFSVNFSAEDMQRDDVFEHVSRFVSRSGMGFDNLVIEATERSFLDVARAQKAVRQFRAAGAKVAIDDFGTGYSSLGCLAQLEIDFLKIDRLFVHALGTDSATSQVANRIIDMAKDLQLGIVAEGIETADQASRLRALGVDFAQGFHFGHPMTVDALLQRLRAERGRSDNVAQFPARAA